MSSCTVGISIDLQTTRRFVLGKQGLWPIRRWQGLQGCLSALVACQALQVDPLSPAARSHEIALWGRVENIQRDYIENLLYQQRACFEYGGGLFIYPIEERPYWMLAMRRRCEKGYWADFGREHASLVHYVRSALRDAPHANRDYKSNNSTQNYRGRRDTSLALYYLWITGEAVIHNRIHNQKVYALAQQYLPAETLQAKSDSFAEDYLALKCVAFHGMIRENAWRNCVSEAIRRQISSEESKTWLGRMQEANKLSLIRVENMKDPQYVLASDLSILENLQNGMIPPEWGDTQHNPQVTFLAPLEIVSARGRAKVLFGFEYLWEVYKPASLRRWGYYTLPILYGEELVARIDFSVEKKSKTLMIKGYWQEKDSLDAEYIPALSTALVSFASYVDSQKVDSIACTGQKAIIDAAELANRVLN